MVSKQVEALTPNARELFVPAMEWLDGYWDEAAGLLREPGDSPNTATLYHSVRGSAWYAMGLLLRNRAGDASRAIRALDTVLNYQFDAPDQIFHGTFFRAPQEPYPPAQPRIWRDYDPNWREFIITTLAVILIEFEEHLPQELAQRIDRAIRKAVGGALARGLSASYTNIALMHAFMLCFASQRLGEPGWFDQGEHMAREVYRLFKQHDAFAEYNSPTYYGVDVYALALWRSYPNISPLLAKLGAEMEALLWKDIVQFYHAGLRNLAGPYDRSYGMDMQRYVALIGEWIWPITGKELAPFPDPTGVFDHQGDMGFVPLIMALGTQIPPEAVSHLLTFQGERQIERVISDSPRRVATAWLGENIMLGGEFTSRTAPQSGQLHPATVHWKVGADQIGWIRLLYSEPVDVQAAPNRLDITGGSELTFRVFASGAQVKDIQHNVWQLPNLLVQVETNVSDFYVGQQADWIEIRYGPGTQAPRTIRCTLITQLGGN